MTLEQEDAKVFLQRLHARTDTGLADTHGIRRMAEVQVFGDSKRLDQGHKRNARSEQSFTLSEGIVRMSF